jgi:hypothetical protein
LNRFLSDGDRSGFGLMNAVTAEARTEPRADRRWRLEELGGGMLAFLKPLTPTLSGGAAEALERPKEVFKPSELASC